jgi:hypothetical protein
VTEQDFNKAICELIGKDFYEECGNNCPHYRKDTCEMENCIYGSEITYGDLHRAKDVINERGEWCIDDDSLASNERQFTVFVSGDMHTLEQFKYKDHNGPEGALRKALEYVLKEME